jgi:negative regulator of flagellin synthesis FlgM
MANKIEGYGAPTKVVTGGSRTGAVGGAAGDGPASGPAAPAADSVTLTSSARTLQKLADAIAASPVVDGARVDAIKGAVAKNTYQVDSQKIADKLIAADREFAGR